ncbi:MAG: hypothetical protein GY807_22100 [Gammaproteobacteria bacterium]|nr:hypothetical protein [Gammaproteobacteria bacterium]
MSIQVTELVPNSAGDAFALKFVVIEGTHAGKSYIGSFYQFPPIHQVGEKLQGRFATDSGAIVSNDMIADRTGMSHGSFEMGATFVFIGFAFAALNMMAGLLSRKT